MGISLTITEVALMAMAFKETPGYHDIRFFEEPRTRKGPAPKKIRGYKADIRTEPKIGRNELCPCGSGLKYKKCCLNNGR